MVGLLLASLSTSTKWQNGKNYPQDTPTIPSFDPLGIFTLPVGTSLSRVIRWDLSFTPKRHHQFTHTVDDTILHQLGWINPIKLGINHLSTGAWRLSV